MINGTKFHQSYAYVRSTYTYIYLRTVCSYVLMLVTIPSHETCLLTLAVRDQSEILLFVEAVKDRL